MIVNDIENDRRKLLDTGKEKDDYDSMFGSDTETESDRSISSNLIDTGTEQDDYDSMFGSDGSDNEIEIEKTISSKLLDTDKEEDDTSNRSRQVIDLTRSLNDTNSPMKRKFDLTRVNDETSLCLQSTIPKKVILSENLNPLNQKLHTTCNKNISNIYTLTRNKSIKSLFSKCGTHLYPHVGFENFWCTLRAWDFLKDLNEHNSSRGVGRDRNTISENSISKIETQTMRAPSLLSSSTIVLPDKFESHQQYKALWSPLLLRESKSQIISDILSSTDINIIPVNVTPTLEIDRDNDIITLKIRHRSSSRVNNSVRSGEFKRGYFTNDLILLTTDPSSIENAFKGVLNNENDTNTISLLSFKSIVTERRGIIGVVANRSRIDGNLLVNVSRRLCDPNWVDSVDMALLRVKYQITAQREFAALCKVNEMPLFKYLLANQHFNRREAIMSHDDPLESDCPDALEVGFRAYVKSKFNTSQKKAISEAVREYGVGGFTLVKGPPGTGKTTTLVALLNALHLRQYHRYYSEIERITLIGKSVDISETLAAINAAAKVKPRILVCAPSNNGVDNIILKIIEDRFVDGNGGKYNPSIVRVGSGQSLSVANVSLKNQVDTILSEGINPVRLKKSISHLNAELCRIQIEIQNLQRRVRVLFNASPYKLSKDWEIRVDEANFDKIEGAIFLNHKLQTVTLTCPPRPQPGEINRSAKSMPHYRSCMDTLVKYIERYNNNHSNLKQLILVQNTGGIVSTGKCKGSLIELNRHLEAQLLTSKDIVMTTLGTAGSKAISRSKKFEVVVVDEAAQSSEPSTIVALSLGSSHAVLVGDPQQLPATIFSLSGRETKYDRSLFQRLEEAGHPVHILNLQYRMHPAISAFPRRIFYEGVLQDGPNVTHKNFGNPLRSTILSNFPAIKPFTIFDLDSVEERSKKSLSNYEEAGFALHLFCLLNKCLQGVPNKGRVALITPYSQQVVLLKRLFYNELGASYTQMVDISTIDAFQGKESNIVILSCVRGYSNNVGIGFLNDVQRMNVALTRAKIFLFVIARCRTILVNPYWRDLIKHARKHQAIIKVPINGHDRIDSAYKKGDRSIEDITFPDLQYLQPLHLSENNNLGL